jgi:hypothetical protein
MVVMVRREGSECGVRRQRLFKLGYVPGIRRGAEATVRIGSHVFAVYEGWSLSAPMSSRYAIWGGGGVYRGWMGRGKKSDKRLTAIYDVYVIGHHPIRSMASDLPHSDSILQ